MKRMKHVGFYCTLTLLCLIMAGCGGSSVGPDMGKVSGTVTMDGAPLPDASVEFNPNMETGGSPSYGGTDADGEYELMFTFDKKGAFLGQHTVRINKVIEDDEGEETETLPAEYNAQSTLTATVEKGSNVCDFALVSGGAPPVASDDDDDDDE